MNLEAFLSEQKIPELPDSSAGDPGSRVVAFDCAVIGKSHETIRIAYQGSIYDVARVDVVDLTNPSTGVVTTSGVGAPAQITVLDTTELQSIKRVRASSIVDKRPFVLARHSDISGILFSRSLSDHDKAWLHERGLLVGSHLMRYTDSTSPSTSQPHLDNWTSDDSQNDGGPRLEQNPEDFG